MKKLFLTAGMLSLLSVGGAVTVTVDGVGGGATTFAKLSQAVAYVNANSSVPNIINVTAVSHTDDTQIQILVPVTINGDPNATGTPAEIKVSRATITPAADIGQTGRSYIEVEAAGEVTVNNHRVFCLDANAATPTIDGISLFKPASGTGEYVFNKLEIGGGTSGGVYIDPTGNDPWTGGRFWYGYQENHGTVHVSNAGGAGNYNSTFNDCHMSLARSVVLYIANKSGTTKVNGGLISGAGEDCVRINGATGVSIVGSAQNRVRIATGNSSNLGSEMRLINGAVIDKLAYTDFMAMPGRGDMTKTPPYGSAILVTSGTISEMTRVRTGNIHAYGLQLQDGYVDVRDSTFHANGNPNFNGSSQPSPDPVRIDSGIAKFKDTIFSSSRGGQVLINGSSIVTFTNCALPTDGGAESLNATPFTGSATNTAPVSASPAYASTSYTISGLENPDFLLPTNNAAYATARSTGTFLDGGAGSPPSSEADWNLY